MTTKKKDPTSKRVILTMGGKGGVGKTALVTVLAEWFQTQQKPVTLLDLDTENKNKGSLSHYFDRAAPKVNIHTPDGLDAFLDYIDKGSSIILADMGAGSGQVAHEWFDTMAEAVSELGVVFTAIGVVTEDPASVESVLSWAARLQDRVGYLIVENALTQHSRFTYWEESAEARRFTDAFKPVVIRMDYRVPDLETATRNHGVTLGQVAERKTTAPELQRTAMVVRANAYRKKMFEEFERARSLLIS
jgi:MinD-like ATPase involved in chromosome partitioning or flagellar assembly